jgi:hypothetical protein
MFENDQQRVTAGILENVTPLENYLAGK